MPPDLRPHRPLRPAAIPTLLLLALGACATPPAFPEPPPELPAAGRELVMVDGRDGSPVAWDALVQRASEVDVVLVGETHGHPEGLAAGAFLFEELVTGHPEGPTLALEFFERDEQVALDDLRTGVLDEAGFIERLELDPRGYPPGHRSMLLAAHAAGRPVWAANAPRRYTSRARSDGFEALRELTAGQRALYDVPEATTPGAYRERFVEAMQEHGGDDLDEDAVDGMYRAQNVWDATMAASVHRAHTEGGRPVVLVVGRFHVEFDGGLAQRLRARAPGLRVLTLCVLDVDADGLRDEDVERADVVIYAGELAQDD